MDESHARRLAGAARILGARTPEQVKQVLRASPIAEELGADGVDAVARISESYWRERFCDH